MENLNYNSSDYATDNYTALIRDEIFFFIEEIEKNGEACAYAFDEKQAKIIANELKKKGYDVEPVYNRKYKNYEIFGVLEDKTSHAGMKVDYLTMSQFCKMVGTKQNTLRYQIQTGKITPAETREVNENLSHYFTLDQVKDYKNIPVTTKSKRIVCIDLKGNKHYFNTLSEVELMSVDTIGVSVSRQTVSKVLKNQRPDFKGYKFMYEAI